MNGQRQPKIETRLIHAGEPHPRIDGAVSMPIYQSSTFEYGGQDSYDDLRYIRMNNTPNHVALHKKLAALENAEAALVAASGMAAITTALLTFLKPGDHFLAQSCLYGGTYEFAVSELAPLGISFSLIDAADPSSWAACLTPRTRPLCITPTISTQTTSGSMPMPPRHRREPKSTSTSTCTAHRTTKNTWSWSVARVIWTGWLPIRLWGTDVRGEDQ